MSSDNPDINAILARLFDELKQHIDQSIQSQVHEHVTRAIEPYTERIEQLEAANQELQTRLDDLSKKIDTLGKSTPTPTVSPQYISKYSDPILQKIDTYRNTKLVKDTDKNNAKKLLDHIDTLITGRDDTQKHAYYFICIFCIWIINKKPKKNLWDKDNFSEMSAYFGLSAMNNPSDDSDLLNTIKSFCRNLQGRSAIPIQYHTKIDQLITATTK
jgi:hypothetical protein